MDRERTRGNRLRERWQDSRAEIAAVQKETGVAKEAVDARGHTDAANSTDFYAAKDKENGYVQAGLNSLQHVRSAIDETLAAAGIPLKFFDKFLIAKHAEERNRTIAQALFAAERIRLGLGTECPGFYFTSMPTMRGLSTTSLGVDLRHAQFCRHYLAVEELEHMEGLHSLCLFTKKVKIPPCARTANYDIICLALRNTGLWRNWLAHWTVDPGVAGSSPVDPASTESTSSCLVV